MMKIYNLFANIRNIFILLMTFSIAGAFFTSSSFAVGKVKPGKYIIATASTGGTYYPVGVAIATLTKIKIEPKYKASISAINSAGSGENVKLIREKQADFAILQGLFGSYAWTGTGPVASSGKQKHLRSISMLWQNVEQIVIKSKYAKTGNVSDLKRLKGKTMGLGKKNSGTIGSNKAIFSHLGYKIDKDFSLFHSGYGPTATALQDGRIDGLNTPAGVPTGALTKLFAASGNKVKPLSFTARQIKQADGGLNLWTKYVIKAGTYPKQSKDWVTIAQPNFLATHKDLDEEFVYLLTKTIYENLQFLNNVHKATKAMAIKKAISGLPVPLHKGAARFYKEAGIKIPKRLLVD